MLIIVEASCLMDMWRLDVLFYFYVLLNFHKKKLRYTLVSDKKESSKGQSQRASVPGRGGET